MSTKPPKGHPVPKLTPDDLEEEPVSSSRWESLMERLDRAWTENKIDARTYQILLEALDEAESKNTNVEGA
jgi:hypothetical protein